MSATPACVLYRKSGEDYPLDEALKDFAATWSDAVVLLAGPSDYRVATLEKSGGCLSPRRQPLDGQFLASAFDVRVICHDAELRWLKQPDGAGRYAWVSEDPLDDSLPGELHTVACHRIIPHRYLLWGEVRHVDNGWATVAEHRIRSITVPVAHARTNQRVWLKAREYLRVADDGNAVLTDERLLGLEV